MIINSQYKTGKLVTKIIICHSIIIISEKGHHYDPLITSCDQVGRLVGIDVVTGLRVGDLVGALEGRHTGVIRVGAREGRYDGPLDDANDAVGLLDGAIVGDLLVGKTVGPFVGIVLGKAVGNTDDGLSVGKSVARVGTIVGASDG